MRRSTQRRAAVVAAYQHDLTGRPLEETLGSSASAFTAALAGQAVERGPELDELIGRHSHGWTVTRIAPLERNILRVALVEMLYPAAIPGEQPISPEGAIDEAVENAKTFCAADAAGFVNGVLDAILREVRENGADEHA
ncbi:MAG TPA: transcription antitermination factor NusB [Solirubrobacteraceae bacterium]|nr:transcription antitermination factor NusB [Solirubrobacteraceae bacterium]